MNAEHSVQSIKEKIAKVKQQMQALGGKRSANHILAPSMTAW